jgi:hypothetical protein
VDIFWITQILAGTIKDLEWMGGAGIMPKSKPVFKEGKDENFNQIIERRKPGSR